MRFVVYCLAFLLPFSAGAQSLTKDITGTVVDPGRAALPRAAVRLVGAGGTEMEATTDSRGRFRFQQLSPGEYQVAASMVGFQTTNRRAGPGDDIEIVLQLLPVREHIVVTATRTEVPTAQVGATVTVISGEEIEQRQELMLAELLQAVPGVATVRNGGLGNVASLFLRGGESDYAKVLLDGIPLNEPGGTFILSNFTADDLERVEIVRGPQSALFGSDAMAGAIQLFTHRGSAERAWPRVRVAGEAGKYDTVRARAGINGQNGRLDYALGWARLLTGNQEPNNAFRNTTVTANLGAALGGGVQVRSILRADAGTAGAPGQTAFGRPDRDALFRKGDVYAGISVRDQPRSGWEQQASLTFARTRQVSRNLIADPPFTPRFEGRSAPFQFSDSLYDFLNDARRQHFTYQADTRRGAQQSGWGQHLLTMALDWDREQAWIADRRGSGAPTRAQRDNTGTTFQHQVFWSRLFLANGVRIEHNGSFGTAVVPRASAGYLLRRADAAAFGATKLKFNFGLGIKEPTFIESFSPSPSFMGNPDLRPERARSFDAGVEQRLWQDRVKAEVSLFHNRFRDQIAFRTISPSPFRGSYINLTETKAQGMEVTLTLAPGGGIRLTGWYTLLDSHIVVTDRPTSPIFRVGQALLRRPRHSGSLLASWSRKNLTLTSSTIFVGRRVDTDSASLQPPLTSNPGYCRWDLGWSYRSPSHLSYFGIVENLLNRRYMEALGYRALRLTYRLGARFEF